VRRASPHFVNLLGSAILQRLTRRPMSGYDLKKLFTTPVGYGWHAWDTQIYRELKRLEQAGLVRGEAQEGRAGPQRRVYSVTPAGQLALANWLQSPLDEGGPKSELTMRIWSLDLIPPVALDGLLATVREQVTTQLEHMQGRYHELREAFGPAETVADPQHVGRLLVLENDIELNQLRLKWLERVATVARVRAVLDSDRRDMPPKHHVQPTSRVTSTSTSALVRARS